MKKISVKRLCSSVLIALWAISLSACTPAAYSEAHEKEITDAHKDDPQLWFDTNLPGAKVTSAKAYASGNDLFCAIKGWYDYEKNSYCYIYDYEDNNMYTTQGYEAFQKELKSAVCKEAGLDESHSILSISNWGISIPTTNDVTMYEKYSASTNGYANIHDDGYIPYTDDVAEYVKKCLFGESYFRYYLYVYEDKPIDFNRDIFETEANLLNISFFLKIDWDYDGICQVEYSKNGIKYKYAHIEEIENGFYAGYYTELMNESDIPPDHSDFEAFSSDSKDITLTIPQDTKPLIFAPNGKKIYHLYESDGKTEKSDLSKYTPGDLSIACPGYSLYNGLVLPTKDLSAFSYYVKGKATFKLQVK